MRRLPAQALPCSSPRAGVAERAAWAAAVASQAFRAKGAPVSGILVFIPEREGPPGAAEAEAESSASRTAAAGEPAGPDRAAMAPVAPATFRAMAAPVSRPSPEATAGAAPARAVSEAAAEAAPEGAAAAAE